MLVMDESTHVFEDASAFIISRPIFESTAPVQELISKPKITFSFFQISLIYIKSIIGPGIIGIPYALHRTGFGLGVVLLILVSLFVDFSLCILIKSGYQANVSSYQDIMEASFGKPGFYLFNFMQFIFSFIEMVIFNIIIGDTTTKIFKRFFNVSQGSAFDNRNSVVFFLTILVTLPLSAQKNMLKLNKFSLPALFLIIGCIFFIVLRSFVFDFKGSIKVDTSSSFGDGLINGAGIITLAFMCPQDALFLSESLENTNQQRWNKVTHISLITSFVLIFITGTAEYFTFMDLTQANILENFCNFDDLANVVRACFTISVVLNYPMECFVIRRVLENTFWLGKPPNTHSHRILLTIVIISIVFICSTLTDCLGIVLELNGILTAVPLALIFPSIAYVKLGPSPKLSWSNFPALFVSIFGIAVTTLGLVHIFLKIEKAVSCSHGQELPYCLGSLNLTSTFTK